MLNPGLDRSALAGSFRAAGPFPHVVIDELLVSDASRRLRDEFPAFERAVNLDESGRPGAKGVFAELRRLGPAFRQLDELFASSAFRDFLTAVSGVPGLLYDPDYIGGGTHENLPGQELDPHVDFNLHPGRPWQRRLNLLYYLNPDWEPDWGGELELYDDPWTSEEPACRIPPLHNRCVLFETSERSWHGFQRVRKVRRSVAAYFYVEQREELASHATIYVERGLPPRPTADEVTRLVERRQAHLQRLIQREQEFAAELQARVTLSLRATPRSTAAQIDAAHWLLSQYDRQLRDAYEREPSWREALRLFEPVAAALLPEWLTGRVEGMWADGWVGPEARLEVEAPAPIERLILRGWIPPGLAGVQTLTVSIGGAAVERALPEGPFEWELAGPVERLRVDLHAAQRFRPSSDDLRELSWVLVGLAQE